MQNELKTEKLRVASGDLVQIEVNGRYFFGVVVSKTLVRFLNHVSDKTDDVNRAIESNELFAIHVHSTAFRQKNWKKVAKVDLSTTDLIEPWMFIQDPFDPAVIQLIRGYEMRQATYQECIGLEKAAVWEATHVESRLQDHFDGKENAFVESMKLVKPDDESN